LIRFRRFPRWTLQTGKIAEVAMIGLGKLLGLGRKEREPAPEAGTSRPFTSPRDFTITAGDLMTDDASLATAFETAVAKAEAGEPYGVALFFAVRAIARNSQFVDEMIDELPGWAFGDRPSDHFAFMVHNWVRATESGERPSTRRSRLSRSWAGGVRATSTPTGSTIASA